MLYNIMVPNGKSDRSYRSSRVETKSLIPGGVEILFDVMSLRHIVPELDDDVGVACCAYFFTLVL